MNPILLAVLASLCWGLGTVMQKHGMSKSFPKITLGGFFRQVGPILKTLGTNWIWMTGLVFMIGGMVNFATALSKADLSVVQPIVCLTGVIAALIGVAVLKEKVLPVEWLGIGLILVGVVVVSSVSSGQTAVIPSNRGMFVFTAITTVMIGGSLLLSRAGLSVEFAMSLVAGLNYGLSNLVGKFLTQRVIAETGSFSLAAGSTYASLATDYPLYIIILVNILGGGAFETAFANGRASVVSPLVTIISTVLPIVAALTILGEAVHLSHAIGIAIVLLGTATLALRPGIGGSHAVTAPAVDIEKPS